MRRYRLGRHADGVTDSRLGTAVEVGAQLRGSREENPERYAYSDWAAR
jgi:hypothetical protein